MRVVTVLSKGPEFRPEHVARIARQVRHFHPEAEITCLTNYPASEIWDLAPCVHVIPLAYWWPGWWAKMELYGPTLSGDVFYMDLDTTVVGPLDDLVTVERSTCLADFYKPALPASGLLYVKEADRAAIFDFFTVNPDQYIDGYKTRNLWGDQGILANFRQAFDFWQDVRPGRVVSYKVHIAHNNGKLPSGAALVCYHGQPRPWTVTESWSPIK